MFGSGMYFINMQGYFHSEDKGSKLFLMAEVFPK
jgi:hypothetical protein